MEHNGDGSSERRSAKEKSMAEKLQSMVEDNEQTIQLVLNVAALTIEKANLTPRQKRISRAGFNFLREVLSFDEEEENTKSTTRSVKRQAE